MTSKFQVGDQVAFYMYDREVGIVKDIDEKGRLVIRRGNYEYTLHPKACRRLRRKAKISSGEPIYSNVAGKLAIVAYKSRGCN